MSHIQYTFMSAAMVIAAYIYISKVTFQYGISISLNIFVNFGNPYVNKMKSWNIIRPTRKEKNMRTELTAFQQLS